MTGKLTNLCAAICLFAGAATAIAASPGQAAAQASSTGVATSNYRLGPGDRLKITTFGEENLTGEYSVSPEGNLSLPLVGAVKAEGLTVGEFEASLEHAMGHGYMTNPRISVDILNFRPFYILGEVNHPGQYPYVTGMTLLNAVATASGYTYRANTHSVHIRRAADAAEHVETITPNTMVYPGDTVIIGERFF